MVKYLGFDVDFMLNALHRHTEQAILSADKNGWTMHILDELNGQYREYKGTLSSVVISAFKPYLDTVKQEQEAIKNKLSPKLNSQLSQHNRG